MNDTTKSNQSKKESIYVEVTVFLVNQTRKFEIIMDPAPGPDPIPDFTTLLDHIVFWLTPHCTVLWTSNDKQSLANKNKQQQTTVYVANKQFLVIFSVEST